MIRYGSVCSGIEAATVAWHGIGWQPAWFSEIEPFPSAMLSHHYPNVPNLGDFTTIGTEHGPVDLIVGGTPCQSFSVAGKRGGMDDARGNLAIEFVSVARRVGARWVVWENVPGVLSINCGRDFGAILGELAERGYGFAYRVLDAQYFGLAQRRARLFVVGYLGDWRPPAAVLFERESLRGGVAPGAKERKIAPTLSSSGAGTSRTGNDRTEVDFLVAHAVTTRPGARQDVSGEDFVPFVADTLIASYGPRRDEAVNLIPDCVSFDCRSTRQSVGNDGVTPTLRSMNNRNGNSNDGSHIAVAFTERTRADGRTLEYSPDLSYAVTNPAGGGNAHCARLMHSGAVRRLTPTECERLQGFPDNYTLIDYKGKPASDSARYRAIGNSMPVPVMRWIGERIELCERVMMEAKCKS